MANFSYKRSTSTTLKACGIIDTDKGIIDVDGVEKDVLALLCDFNGSYIEFVVKLKDEEELEEPDSSNLDEE